MMIVNDRVNAAAQRGVAGDAAKDLHSVCNAVSNVASRRVKQKTGAEFVGLIELAHHDGQTKSEKWIVTRDRWLGRGSCKLDPAPNDELPRQADTTGDCR